MYEVTTTNGEEVTTLPFIRLQELLITEARFKALLKAGVEQWEHYPEAVTIFEGDFLKERT